MNQKFLYSLLALALLTIASCDALKPATSSDRDRQREADRRAGNDDLGPIQSRRVYDPESGTYVIVQNAPTSDMDTVRWTTTSEQDLPPIVETTDNTYVPPANGAGVKGPSVATQMGTGANGSRLLSSYNVEFALPFLTNKYLGSEDDVDDNSLWALHFYSGAKMALDELRSTGKGDFYVGVDDTEADAGKVRTLTGQPNFRAAQMVVGPYVKGNVTAMAESVKGVETVLVSPFSAGTGVSAQNPNYVQVNPTLTTHLKNILDHAVNSQNADRIVLVTSDSKGQKGRLDALQRHYKFLQNDPAADSLEVLSVDLNERNPDASFDRFLTGRKTVFIVPVYEDESFVANFLRRLYADTRDDFGRGVAVYGLPQWADYTRINFDYYEGTNVHISSSAFIDVLDPAVRDFRRQFYREFNELPRDEAFVGYDVTRYFMRMLDEYGTRFQYSLPDNPETLLHTKFRFEPVVDSAPGDPAVEGGSVDRFENMFVNILRFRDYTFRRVN